MAHSTQAWDRWHPRPQLARESFLSLNGEWQLNGRSITVPWPPQAPLSGYEGEVPDTLEYRRSFEVPEGWRRSGRRVRLHFGAVDQVCTVLVNGTEVARHEGGYLPFSADITAALIDGPNELVVIARDELDLGYPYGKQRRKRGGMWYTPVSGIWQTVWLESVPDKYIRGLTMVPTLDALTLTVDQDAPEAVVTIVTPEGEMTQTIPCRSATRIDIPDPRLWTCEDPYLYRMRIEAGEDTVQSYFALRTVEIREVNGHARICLNGKPILLQGVLDQGWFPDGLYLPETPEAYERDILSMKAPGMNLLRKHIKLEPEAFYEACDRLGMLVLQDMVNVGPVSYVADTVLPTIGLKWRPDILQLRPRLHRERFLSHTMQTIEHLFDHPCIIGWTVFNEGWGQFDSDRIYARVKRADPTRFCDSTSGWFAQRCSDVDSVHCYFRNRRLHPRKRPMLLSECGGYARPIPGHMWDPEAKYGYGAASTAEALSEKIELMYRVMVLPAIPEGLCGVIYTQLSDIEDEINGLYTYDREVCKADAERLRAVTAEAERVWEQAVGTIE